MMNSHTSSSMRDRAPADAAERDLTKTPAFIEMHKRISDWFQAGSNQICDLAEISLSPDGGLIAGTGTLFEQLDGVPQQRVCLIDLANGQHEIVSSGPRNDRLPCWAPDGARIAYISDRDEPFNFQVQILDLSTRTEVDVRLRDMWVEYALWSPDGKRLLIGAAGTGVDLAGAQGGIPSPLKAKEEAPAWAPAVDAGVKATQWRTLWTYAVDDGTIQQVSPTGVNVWEAAWCGNEAIVCIASDAPGEEDWYRADVRRIELGSGKMDCLFRPSDQIGWISASPNGQSIAFAEAVCSDRTIVAGVLTLVDERGSRTVDTNGVDVTSTAWQGERHVLYSGHRSFETVLGLLDVDTGDLREIWSSADETFGSARYPEASPGTAPGDVAMVIESFHKPATVATINGTELREVCSFATKELVAHTKVLGAAKPYRWTAPDGLEIHGWIITPNRPGPYPVVMDVHGGPVWQSRPTFLGRPHWVRFLLEAGYAVFRPNVRGSSGRGQDYARHVFGDMGGADTNDFLSGLDALVADGIVDPERIGVTGGSYGGYISSWLITQDPRFAAAVPIAPVTDWVSEHLTCHIPHFCELFLNDDMSNPGGKYFSRSPIMFADQVRTPTLHVCGALDQNTPAVQALEFHHALTRRGATSVLVTYPQEGHGVRKYPAFVDFLVRLVGWFETHMPAGSEKPIDSTSRGQ